MLPAAIAFAGSIWGLFSLTLGQDPANALPHWSPVTGWTIGLGSLALATALFWVAATRRRCPDCGSPHMLDGMEEESLVASERNAAQTAAVDAARIEWETHGPVSRAPQGASAAEAPPAPARETPAQAKDTADRFAALEKELRDELERRVRAERAEHEKQSLDNERVLRTKLEEELRAQVETKLRAEIEKQVRASVKAATPPPVSEPRPVTSPAPATAARSVTPSPVTTGKALSTSPAPATAAKPVTPSPITTGKALSTSPAPATAAKPVTPSPITSGKALSTSPAPATAAKSITPSPVTTGKALSTSPAPATAAKSITPSPVTMGRTGVTSPAAAGATPAKSQPTNAKVETAPISLMSSAARPTVRPPAATVSVQTSSQAQQPPADPHERAKRRARVILSDLIAYHRDELVKAAEASDPRKELGSLWRDAVVSYNEAAPPELRGVTNYLEEELTKQLAELRRS